MYSTEVSHLYRLTMLSHSYTHIKLRYLRRGEQITLLLSRLPFAPFQSLASFVSSCTHTHDTDDTACAKATVLQPAQRILPNWKMFKAGNKDTQCFSLPMRCNRPAESRDETPNSGKFAESRIYRTN